MEDSRCFNFNSNLDLNLNPNLVVEESITGGENVVGLKIGKPRRYVHVVAEERRVSIFDGSSKFRGTA